MDRVVSSVQDAASADYALPNSGVENRLLRSVCSSPPRHCSCQFSGESPGSLIPASTPWTAEDNKNIVAFASQSLSCLRYCTGKIALRAVRYVHNSQHGEQYLIGGVALSSTPCPMSI